MSENVTVAVAEAFTAEWGRLVATLIGQTGDWDLAEDCAQQAFAEAVRRWPIDGVPCRPGAWLTTVARNRAIDRLRHETMKAKRLRELATMPDGGVEDDQSFLASEHAIEDERLRLMFTCCHPALSLEARVALTLRSLAGLSTTEIARAFLVSEATMAKRLVRAKHKIVNARIPYRVPPANLLPQRTSGILAVLYLLFNEGYAASLGPDLIRADLCAEAIRLARALTVLMPDESEASGLLALMLFQHSRRLARVDRHGDLVTLEDQDRSLWDRGEVGDANAALQKGLRGGTAGPYALQAAIAACHANATDSAATSWNEIASLYAQLLEVMPQPLVRLNHAVAISMAEGPAEGLLLVDQILASGELRSYHLVHATRANLLSRLDRPVDAAAALRVALSCAPSATERRYLTKRLAEACIG